MRRAAPTWAPNVQWKVRALAATSTRLFLGGDFTANGQSRPHLAAYDLDTRSLSGWAPSTDGQVKALAVSPYGSQVVVGGNFSTVNGTARRGLARVSSSTGALDTAWKPKITGPDIGTSVFGLVVTSSTVYAGVGGPHFKRSARSRTSGSRGSTPRTGPWTRDGRRR